jgi:hypothetical protein
MNKVRSFGDESMLIRPSEASDIEYLFLKIFPLASVAVT